MANLSAMLLLIPALCHMLLQDVVVVVVVVSDSRGHYTPQNALLQGMKSEEVSSGFSFVLNKDDFNL